VPTLQVLVGALRIEKDATVVIRLVVGSTHWSVDLGAILFANPRLVLNCCR